MAAVTAGFRQPVAGCAALCCTCIKPPAPHRHCRPPHVCTFLTCAGWAAATGQDFTRNHNIPTIDYGGCVAVACALRRWN